MSEQELKFRILDLQRDLKDLQSHFFKYRAKAEEEIVALKALLGGVADTAEEALNLARTDFKRIKRNPGWQDNEVGYISGHIAAAQIDAIKKAIGEIRRLKKP